MHTGKILPLSLCISIFEIYYYYLYSQSQPLPSPQDFICVLNHSSSSGRGWPVFYPIFLKYLPLIFIYNGPPLPPFLDLHLTHAFLPLNPSLYTLPLPPFRYHPYNLGPHSFAAILSAITRFQNEAMLSDAAHV